VIRSVSFLLASVLLWGVPSAHALVLQGRVVERGSGEALVGVRVECVALRVGVESDEAGRFRLELDGAGPWDLRFVRAGLLADSQRISDAFAGDLVVVLDRAPVPMAGVGVSAASGRATALAGQRPVDLRGATLRERLGRTIAETLAGEPGVERRSLGPSASRPVVRGLGAERLPVLEDGGSTGDLSASADDHAVTVEPALSRAVELVRGPATLEMAPNVLGGVVNVQRDYVPVVRPEGVRTILSVQGETVTRGGVAAATTQVPLGAYVLSLQSVGRRTGSIDTPLGRLTNTEAKSSDLAAGVSRIGANGFVGASWSRYRNRYGIPGGYLGGHREGVDLDVQRERGELRAESRARSDRAWGVEGSWLWTRYYHREIEDRDLPAVSFGVVTQEARAVVRWPGAWGGAAIGGSYEHRDFRTGFMSFTPATVERSGALFAHRAWERSHSRLRLGGRGDVRRVDPDSRTSNKAGVIRRRDFATWAAGALAEHDLATSWTLTASVMRSAMAPTVEHLFSEGPHLASYAYEVGNADLEAETALGLQAGVRWEGARHRTGVTLFHHDFDGYQYAADTGVPEVGPGAEGLLERYQWSAAPVRMWGFESDLRLEWGGGWRLEGGAGMVMGVLTADGSPLQSMPPLRGRLSLVWAREAWSVRVGAEGVAAQRRVAEYEATTDGSWTASATVSWEHATPMGHMSVVVQGHNLTDAVVRDHLSRIRSISPDAGRNLRLGVRWAR
jgi:iron complex outermembrane recepter protein